MKILGALRRHPWVCACGLAALLAFAVGGYALVFYYNLRAAHYANEHYDFEEAHARFAFCIRLWPRQASLYLQAARAARRARQLDEAADLLSECQRLEGPNSENLLEHAMLRAQQGDFRDSGNYLLKLLQSDPPEAPLILEAIALGTDRVYLLGESMNIADELLKREPGNVPILILRGQLWHAAGKHEEEENNYRLAVESQPEHAQARLELAKFLLQRERFEEAEAQFEPLRKRHYRPSEVLFGLALCQRHHERIDEERKLLDGLLETSPHHVGALAERGRLELVAGELEAAERDFRAALAQVPYDPRTNYHLSQCLQRMGRLDEGAEVEAATHRIEADLGRLEKLAAAIAKNPKDPELLRQAGMICLENGRAEEAERWFLGSWQIDPLNKSTNQALVDLYTKAGRPDKAAEYLPSSR